MITPDALGPYLDPVAILIVAVLAYVLIPVSRRLGAARQDAEPSRIDLSTGVAVAGVRVRSADAATTLGSETVVIVLGGRATAGSAEPASVSRR